MVVLYVVLGGGGGGVGRFMISKNEGIKLY